MAVQPSNGEIRIAGRTVVDAQTRDQITTAANSVYKAAGDVGNAVTTKSQAYLDRVIPAEKREAYLTRIQGFINARPLLAAFIGINLLLTGVPVAVFSFFAASVFFTTLVTTIFLALLATITFSAFTVGAALLILLPTIFFTTITAGFLFTWGLGTYYLLKWVAGKRAGQSDTQNQTTREALNRITGGKVDDLERSVKRSTAQQGPNDTFSEAWNKSENRQNGVNPRSRRSGVAFLPEKETQAAIVLNADSEGNARVTPLQPVQT